MNTHYVFFMNTISTIVLIVIYIQEGTLPWYLKAVLTVNIIAMAVVSIVLDMKNQVRDDKLKSLEKELDELRQEKKD